MKLNQKIQHIFIRYDGKDVGVFSNTFSDPIDSNQKANAIAGVENSQTIIHSNLEASKINDAVKTELKGSINGGSITYSIQKSNNEYDFILSELNQNTEIHLSWVPWLVTPNAQLLYYDSNNNESYRDNDTSKEFLSITEANDIKLNEKIGKAINANNNQVITLDIKIKPAKLYSHYIYDVLEHKNPENADTRPVEVSRFNDYWGDLIKYAFTRIKQYKTSPIVSDTDIYVRIEPLKKIKLKQTDNGTTTFKSAGLKAPVVEEVATENISANQDFTEVKQNTIFKNATESSKVGYRRFDEVQIEFKPDPGYYIKTVKVGTNVTDTKPTLSSIVIATLPTNEHLGARDFILESVSQNVWIDVEYVEKPTLPTYWLGTDF